MTYPRYIISSSSSSTPKDQKPKNSPNQTETYFSSSLCPLTRIVKLQWTDKLTPRIVVFTPLFVRIFDITRSTSVPLVDIHIPDVCISNAVQAFSKQDSHDHRSAAASAALKTRIRYSIVDGCVITTRIPAPSHSASTTSSDLVYTHITILCVLGDGSVLQYSLPSPDSISTSLTEESGHMPATSDFLGC